MSDTECEKRKTNRVIGFSAMDDGGPGGEAYSITEDDMEKAQTIYDKIFGGDDDTNKGEKT